MKTKSTEECNAVIDAQREAQLQRLAKPRKVTWTPEARMPANAPGGFADNNGHHRSGGVSGG